jgi:hypothetical protein
LPAKYGGDVTTKATDASSTSAIVRASAQNTSSTALRGETVESPLTAGLVNRS